MSNLIDPSPKWRLKVNPIVSDPSELERQREGARANEILLNHQLRIDKYAEKQRPFDLQALTCGLSVSKQYWLERTGPRRLVEEYEEPVLDFYGNEIGAKYAGLFASVSARPTSAVRLEIGPEINVGRTVQQYVRSATDLRATSTYGVSYVFGEIT